MSTSRFWWLRSNKFFETTSLTGYSFLSHSKHRIELTFWYACLFVFIAFTLRSVNEAVSDYLAHGTITGAGVSHTITNGTLPSFNLSIEMSLYEFDQRPLFSPLEDSFEHLKLRSKIASIVGRLTNPTEPYLEQVAKFKNIEEYQKYVSTDKNQANMGFNNNNDSWTDKMETIAAEIKEIYTRHRLMTTKMQEILSRYLTYSAQMVEDFQNVESGKIDQLVEKMTARNVNSLLPALIALEAAKFEHTPYTFASDEQFDSVLADLHLETILDIATALFNKVLHFRSSVEGTEYYLRDWSSNLQRNSHTLTMHIEFPIGTQDGKVDIFLANMVRSLHLLQAYMTNLYEKWYDDMMHEVGDCQSQSYDAQKSTICSLQNELAKTRVFNELMNHYQETTTLSLSIGGTVMPLAPGFYHILTISPEGHVVSNIDECSTQGIAECIDQCVHDSFIAKCQCHPWPLLYIKSDKMSAFCSEPCAGTNTEDCMQNCEEKVAHPCNQVIHRLDAGQQSIPINHLKYDVYSLGSNITDDSDQYLKQLYLSELRQFQFKLRPDLPWCSIHIKALEMLLHPKYTEEYELTFTSFVGRLGGAVDFLLGINLVGILHLSVYVIKQLRHLSDPNSKTGKTVRLLFSKKITTSPSDNLRLSIQSAKERSKTMAEKFQDAFKKHKNKITDGSSTDQNVDISEENGEESRFGFLRHNRLFETTTLTGYSFINDAKSRVEVAFWYCTLFVLTVFTIRNVNDTLNTYFSKPTNTLVFMQSDTTNVSIQNFTLRINSSFFDGQPFEYFAAPYDRCSDLPLASWTFDAATIAMDISSALYLMEESFFKGPFKSDKTSEYNRILRDSQQLEGGGYTFSYIWGKQRKLMAMKLKLFEKRNLTDWDEWYSAMSSHIRDAWDGVTRDQFDDDGDWWNKACAQFGSHTIRDSNLYVVHEIYMALLMLKAARIGLQPPAHPKLDFFWRYHNVSEPQSATAMLPIHPRVYMPWKTFYDTTHRYLTNQFVLSNGTIHLTDWKTFFTTGEQEHEYKIMLPPGVDHLTIEIYSFNLARYLEIWRSFADAAFQIGVKKFTDIYKVYYENLVIKLQHEFCRDYEAQTWYANQDKEAHYYVEFLCDYMPYEFLDFYKQSTSVALDMNQAGVVQLQPFKTHQLDVSVAAVYRSETDNCFEGTPEQCIEACFNDFHHRFCQCYPWWLSHLNQNPELPLCEQPCPQLESNQTECVTQCERESAHPCSATIYRLLHGSSRLKHHRWSNTEDRPIFLPNTPLVRINLHKTQGIYHFPEFVERYEMNFGDLTAELGGALEFYLGISVIAIIHLFIYIFKQIRHMSKPESKARKNVRHLISGRRTLSYKTD